MSSSYERDMLFQGGGGQATGDSSTVSSSNHPHGPTGAKRVRLGAGPMPGGPAPQDYQQQQIMFAGHAPQPQPPQQQNFTQRF